MIGISYMELGFAPWLLNFESLPIPQLFFIECLYDISMFMTLKRNAHTRSSSVVVTMNTTTAKKNFWLCQYTNAALRLSRH